MDVTSEVRPVQVVHPVFHAVQHLPGGVRPAQADLVAKAVLEAALGKANSAWGGVCMISTGVALTLAAVLRATVGQVLPIWGALSKWLLLCMCGVGGGSWKSRTKHFMHIRAQDEILAVFDCRDLSHCLVERGEASANPPVLIGLVNVCFQT